MLTITDIYKYNLAILFNNIKNNKITGTTNLQYLNTVHNHSTRLATSHNYYQSRSNTNLGKSTFSTQGLKFWRTLPLHIKSLTLNIFKKEVKNILVSKYELDWIFGFPTVR